MWGVAVGLSVLGSPAPPTASKVPSLMIIYPCRIPSLAAKHAQPHVRNPDATRWHTESAIRPQAKSPEAHCSGLVESGLRLHSLWARTLDQHPSGSDRPPTHRGTAHIHFNTSFVRKPPCPVQLQKFIGPKHPPEKSPHAWLQKNNKTNIKSSKWEESSIEFPDQHVGKSLHHSTPDQEASRQHRKLREPCA